jgi:hypothetical protein
MRKVTVFGFVVLLTLIIVSSLSAQSGEIKLTPTEQSTLQTYFQKDDALSFKTWLFKNPTKVNGEFDNGIPLLAKAITFDAVNCFNTALEAKADSNVVWIVNNGLAQMGLFQILLIKFDNIEKVKTYLTPLLANGYDLNRKHSVIMNDNSKFQFTDSAMVIAYKTPGLVDLLPWLIESGLDPTIPLSTYSSSSELRSSMTPADYAKDQGLSELAKTFSDAETQFVKNRDDKENAAFQKVLGSLKKYHGKEEVASNLDLLSNPNSFEEQEGYYFSNVLPVKWLSRDRVICRSVDLSLLGNRGESELFVLYIEDSSLRKSFTTKKVTSPNGASMEFGFDVIVTPAEDQQYDGALPYLKLLSMKPAKLSLSF